MLSCNGRCFPIKGLVSLGQHHPKCFSASTASLKSYYDSLGITAHATQTDIKAAYYKLSMMYHPDKNKGSESASEKFRDITAAYEVLGNFKLRKLYDKGILHTGMAGAHYHGPEEETVVEDDATTKFYKARMNRNKPPTPTGRTPIYNFDEWSRVHYGASFARRQAASKKFERKTANVTFDRRDMEKEYVIFGVAFFVLAFFFVSFTTSNDYDIVTTPMPVEKGANSISDSVPESPRPL